MSHQPGIAVGIVDQIRIAGFGGLKRWLDATFCGWAFAHRTYPGRRAFRKGTTIYECYCGRRGGVVDQIEYREGTKRVTMADFDVPDVPPPPGPAKPPPPVRPDHNLTVTETKPPPPPRRPHPSQSPSRDWCWTCERYYESRPWHRLTRGHWPEEAKRAPYTWGQAESGGRRRAKERDPNYCAVKDCRYGAMGGRLCPNHNYALHATSAERGAWDQEGIGRLREEARAAMPVDAAR